MIRLLPVHVESVMRRAKIAAAKKALPVLTALASRAAVKLARTKLVIRLLPVHVASVMQRAKIAAAKKALPARIAFANLAVAKPAKTRNRAVYG